MRGVVQVAGIHDKAEADMLAEEGVDWLGLPLRLPKYNEDISEGDAAAVIASIQPPHAGVLISYMTIASEVKAFCDVLGVRTVQLHGDVETSELRALKKLDPDLYVLKSLVVKERNAEELLKIVDDAAEWVDMFITDTFNPATGAKGATALTHDWNVSAELVCRSPRPLMMAGGLTPENVAAAIEKVRPAAVDAHSCLEDASGRKDRDKVRKFVAESRAAFERVPGGISLG
jgi:phosphoribosylanthranilate isomerase